MSNTLEKASEIAKAEVEKIEAPAKAQAAEAESKAAEAKAKDAEAQKAKDDKSKVETEAKAKDEVRILSAEDADLNEADQKRKVELLADRKIKDNTPDGKIERIKAESQKRIDEIKGELLQTQHKGNAEIAALKAELEGLKKSIQPKLEEDAKVKSKREETERISKYVEEDKAKPEAERREMTQEALNEWYLSDPVAATEWMQERTIRRADDRKAIEAKAKEDQAKGQAKLSADDFIAKQNESKDKLFAKFPGVNPLPRVKELQKEGKSNAQITDILCAENEEYRLCTEIVAADPKRYLEAPNGPELIMDEMEKRLKAEKTGNPGKNGKLSLTQEELDAKIQAEIDRRASLDEGISSTKGRKMDNNTTKSKLRQEQERVAKRAGISMEALDKQLARRKTIPGAGTFKEDDD